MLWNLYGRHYIYPAEHFTDCFGTIKQDGRRAKRRVCKFYQALDVGHGETELSRYTVKVDLRNGGINELYYYNLII